MNSCGFFGNARVPAWPALPHHFKLLGGQIKTPFRLSGLALLAFVIGMTASFVSIIYIAYHYGGQNLHLAPFSSSAGPVGSYNAMRSDILRVDRTVFDPGKMIVWLFGGLQAGLLILLRNRLPWWPIHPLGLAFQDTRGLRFYSFSLFASPGQRNSSCCASEGSRSTAALPLSLSVSRWGMSLASSPPPSWTLSGFPREVTGSIPGRDIRLSLIFQYKKLN